MKFITTYELGPDHRTSATERFLGGGAPPPAGVVMHGRWHDVNMRRGFLLCEADDASALAAWTAEWADLLVFEVIPVIEDAEAAAVLSAK